MDLSLNDLTVAQGLQHGRQYVFEEGKKERRKEGRKEERKECKKEGRMRGREGSLQALLSHPGVLVPPTVTPHEESLNRAPH